MWSDSVVFTKRVPWRLWILLFLCLEDVCAGVDQDKCRRPEIESPKPPLVAYERTATINVTVYHCLYHHEIICNGGNNSACFVEILKYTHVVKSTHRYSDITTNCINAFNSSTFKDKYGIPHIHYKNYTPVTFKSNDNTFDRIVTISLTNYTTEVDLGRDIIKLRSGTVCRYTSGFCHDETENIDVMWEVKDGPDECLLYRKINFSDMYYFKLGQKRYAILEWDGKYFPLELINKKESCKIANTWKTREGNLIVAKGPLASAQNSSLDPTNFLEFYFEIKQDLYDFLFEECIADLQNGNTNPMLLKQSFAANLKLRDEHDKLNKLDDQIQRLLSKVDTFVYVTAFNILCLASVIIISVYFILKRNSSIAHYIGPGPSLLNAPPNIANAYEYITSEYDINSVYDKKYCEVSRNNNNALNRSSHNSKY